MILTAAEAATVVSAATKATAAMTTVARKDMAVAVTTGAKRAAMEDVRKEDMAAVTTAATAKKAVTAEVATAERRDSTAAEVMAMTVPPAAVEATDVMATAAKRAGMAEDVKR